MHFQTCGHSGVPDLSLTPETMENTYHMEKTLSWDQEEIVTLLRGLLDERITPVMTLQIRTFENSFTRKMENLLRQLTLLIANTQTAQIDPLYGPRRQENTRLQIQVQDLSRQLCSTVSARPTSLWKPTTTGTPLPNVPDTRVADAATNRQTPREQEQEARTPELRLAQPRSPPAT